MTEEDKLKAMMLMSGDQAKDHFMMEMGKSMTVLNKFVGKKKMDSVATSLIKSTQDLSMEYIMNKDSLIGKYFIQLPNGDYILQEDARTNKGMEKYKKDLEQEISNTKLELLSLVESPIVHYVDKPKKSAKKISVAINEEESTYEEVTGTLESLEETKGLVQRKRRFA
jgi:hypothetical protein